MGSNTHHRRRAQLRGAGYFRRIGPGVITGVADDDPSGIGTYSQVGASSGFALLWTAIATLPLAIAVQEATARLGLVTGKGLAALIRERFPRWILLGSVILVTVANTFNIGADIGSMAAATQLLVPIPWFPLVVFFTLGMAIIEVAIPYHQYSKVLRWLCLSIVSYLVVLFFIKASWGTVASRTLVPRMEFSRGNIAALIAIFGTTISPYLFFWQAGEEVEELHQSNNSHGIDTTHIQAMRGDVSAGMATGVLVMFSIMVTAAATIGRQGGTTIESAEQAAQALRPLAGDLAGFLFTLGIVGVGLLAVPVLAGSTAYAMSEAFGWKEGLGLRLSQARTFYLVIIGSMMGGLVMNLVGMNAVKGLYYAAILNGLAAPPLIVLIWVLSRSRDVLGQHASGRVSQSFLIGAAAISVALPILLLIAR